MMKPDIFKDWSFGKLVRDRVAQTLALGVVFIALGSVIRPPEMVERIGVDHTYAFLQKAHFASGQDVVIAGDSRVYSSLSPEVMRETLGDVSILNFAFEGNGYSDAYLERIGALVDTISSNPTVILGISPVSLTQSTLRWNGYQNCMDRKGWALYRDMYMPQFLRYFDPYDWRYVYHLASGADPSRLVWEYHIDGFVGVDKIPMVFEIDLETHRKRFSNNPVLPERVEALLAHIKEWQQKGITVYGFRPPTCAEIVALENEMGQFDEAEFVRQFEEAGGAWIDVDQNAYATHDGHHLLRS